MPFNESFGGGGVLYIGIFPGGGVVNCFLGGGGILGCLFFKRGGGANMINLWGGGAFIGQI